MSISGRSISDNRAGTEITDAEGRRIMDRVAAVGVFGNILLTAVKMAAGIAGNSGAMVSDAVHSLSDVFATFIAWIGTRIAGRQADRSHPYGHERFEVAASMILGIILLITAVSIGMAGIREIAAGDHGELPVPGAIALSAAVISIAAKEAMFWYTRHYARILDSQAFMADAWHHRSDALSSVGSLIGIGGAMLGFPVMDPLASVVICLFILKVSYDILIQALQNMMDTSCPDEYEERLREYISSCPGVGRLDVLRTRMFGSKIYIDAEIAVDGDMPLRDAHEIAENVHDGVEGSFENVKHIMIHVNPLQTDKADQ